METNKILKLLNSAESLPYLFVGSGFSKRYYNTPTWEELLKYLASLVNEDEFYYAKIVDTVSRRFNKNKEYNSFMTAICDELEVELSNIWFTDDRFAENRQKYKNAILEKNCSPLKIEIAEYLSNLTIISKEMQEELDILTQTSNRSIAGVITTNYDKLLENIFEFEVYRSQDELLFNTNYNINELYKIHGCVTMPESILINSKDYDSIKEKHKYLTAKLLTIFLEHPIIFIGYSIGDEDILNILKDITSCVGPEKLSIIEKRFFFVNWDSSTDNIEVSEHSIHVADTFLKFTKITLNDFSKLYEILLKNKKKYPVKLIRSIQESIYELTITSQAKDRLLVNIPDFDNIDNFKDVEFVVGFGAIERAKSGYISPKAFEIYEDIILDTYSFDANLLLKHSYLDLCKKHQNLPLYKYLKRASSETREFIESNITKKISVLDFKSNSYKKNSPSEKTIPELCSFNIPDMEWSTTKIKEFDKTIINILTLINDDTSSSEILEIKQLLSTLFTKHPKSLDTSADKTYNKTHVRSLIKIIDFLENK